MVVRREERAEVAAVDLRNPARSRRSPRSATRSSSNRLPTVTCDEARREGSEVHQVRKEGRERAACEREVGVGLDGWTKNN